MRAKKYIAYITILTVIITAVCGCRSDGKDLSSGDAGLSASGIFSTDDVVYADSDGDSRYAIVRPDNASADVTGAATAVFSAMKNSLGLRSKNILDSVSDGSDAYEILMVRQTDPKAQPQGIILSKISLPGQVSSSSAPLATKYA